MRLLVIFFVLVCQHWAVDYKWEAPLGVLSSAVSALSTDVSSLSTNPSKWSTNGTAIYYNGGKVGIGTASPASKLDVLSTSSSVLGYGNAVGFEDTSTWYQSLAFYLNNASGLWGGKPSAFIGVGNSTARLLMSAGAQIGGNDALANWAIPSTPTASFLSLSGEDLIFFGNTGLTPSMSYTPTERFRIDGATGNIGIGTASPGGKFSVDGVDGENIYTYLSSRDQIAGARVTTFDFKRQGPSGYGGFAKMGFEASGTGAGYALSLKTGTTDTNGIYDSTLMTWLPSGNVGIGTASPDHKLHISQTATVDTTGILLDDTGTSAYSQYISWKDAWITDGGGTRVRIRGDVAAAGEGRFGVDVQDGGTLARRLTIRGSNVGIGTESPSELQPGTKGLSIYDASAAGLTLGNASNWFTWYLSSSSLKLYSGGGTPVDNIFVADNTGKIGIGTAAPQATLHVTGTAQVNLAYSGVYVETGISVVNQSTGNSPSIDLINDTQSETINIMNNSGVFTVSRGGVSGVSFGDVLFLVSDNGIRLDTQTNIPTAKTDSCTPKTTTWDANYMYYCEYSGNWKRIAWDNSSW